MTTFDSSSRRGGGWEFKQSFLKYEICAGFVIKDVLLEGSQRRRAGEMSYFRIWINSSQGPGQEFISNKQGVNSPKKKTGLNDLKFKKKKQNLQLHLTSSTLWKVSSVQLGCFYRVLGGDWPVGLTCPTSRYPTGFSA